MVIDRRHNIMSYYSVLSSSSQRRIDGSALFDGTTKYLYASASADFNIGTADCTVEWFQHAKTFGDANTRVFQLGIWPSDFGVSMEEMNDTVYFWSDGTTKNSFAFDNIYNRWIWFSVSRVGGFLHIFQDGKLKFRAANTDAIGNSTDPFTIGVDVGYLTTTRFKGNISNFRFIKGVGLYSGSVVGTTYYGQPTPPLTSTAETKLLLHMNSSSSLETDSSGNRTVWNVGGVSHSTL